MSRLVVLFFTGFIATTSLAHHSVSSLYDYTNVIKLEGTLPPSAG
jgi:hypothetical protein